MVGEQTAERDEDRDRLCSARSARTRTDGGPRPGHDLRACRARRSITSEEIREALQEPLSAIIEAVTRTLERAEPELAADLVDNGITLAGGGALLRGLPEIMQKATGLDVRLADDPLTCVARGTATYLENIEVWKQTLENDMDI